MDPEIALNQLRELADIVMAAHGESTDDFSCVSPIELEFAEKFQALDEWLSNKGYKPGDWL